MFVVVFSWNSDLFSSSGCWQRFVWLVTIVSNISGTDLAILVFSTSSVCLSAPSFHTVHRSAQTWSTSAKLCNTGNTCRCPIGCWVFHLEVWLKCFHLPFAKSVPRACLPVSFTNLAAERLSDMWRSLCLFCGTHVCSADVRLQPEQKMDSD